MPELVTPTVAVHRSFLRAMQDFAAEGRGAPEDHTALAFDMAGYADRWDSAAGMADFVVALRRAGDVSVPPPPGWVHCSTYWWVDDVRYLGTIRIRHSLTERLRQLGGHIGYDVAPADRRRGHGTSMLRAALPITAALGIDSALITCDSDNLGSRRIIESCGGVLEDERAGKRRYWVPTGAPAASGQRKAASTGPKRDTSSGPASPGGETNTVSTPRSASSR
jgi:predicted acetyltransferase